MSQFIAALLGPTLFILGLFFIVNHQALRRSLAHYSGNVAAYLSSGHFLMSSVVPFVVGLSIVLQHNLWVAEWYVVITIIGWLFLLVGAVGLIFPEQGLKRMEKFCTEKELVWEGVVDVVLGLYLSYYAFTF